VALTFGSGPDTTFGARGAFPKFLFRKRDLGGLPVVVARSGDLEARLATTAREVRAAQKLRYRAFCKGSGAAPSAIGRLARRDLCSFDSVCDHLIVVDKGLARLGRPEVVGVYRLLRQDVAERHFGFYSAREFELAPLMARRPGLRFLEVGRACVAESHRGRHVLDLLWRGLWLYARHHGLDALIGCASLPGADPARHSAIVHALASGGDPALRVLPLPERAAAMPDASGAPSIDPRALRRALPPLVKGYLRLGATFSPIPAVDRAFGSTDLFVVMPLSEVEPRYLEHFGVEAPRRLVA